MKVEEAMEILAGTGRPGALARVQEEIETLRVRAEAAEAKVAEMQAEATDVPTPADPPTT